MVLVVGNSVVVRESPIDLESFLSSSSRLREDVDTFKAREKRTVQEEEGLLYVGQHEFACTHPSDPSALVLGSTDATTCQVAVLRHPTSGVTAVAHLDGADGMGRNLSAISDRIFELTARLNPTSSPDRDLAKTLEISLVGGFQDELGKSEELSLGLFRDLVKSDVNFILGLCCVGSLNTTTKKKRKGHGKKCCVASIPFPIFYGCAVEVSTGDIFPAEFPSQGPELILRHARCSFNRDGSSDLYEVYDAESGCFRIPPFSFHNFPWLTLWCKASPKDILSNMSTSPEVEPDHFVSTLKAAMRLVIENPNPRGTIFDGGRTIRSEF